MITELDSLPENIVNDELTVEKATQLLFLSFRFSQGEPKLQFNIFVFLHHLRPDWKISRSMKKEIFDAAQPILHRFLAPKEIDEQNISNTALHTTVSLTSLDNSHEATLFSELVDMKIAFDDPVAENPIEAIAESMIERDLYYLSERKGRPHTKQSYLSQVFYYGIDQHPTGAEEYDEMFRQVVDEINNADSTTLGNLQKIANVHYSHTIRSELHQ